MSTVHDFDTITVLGKPAPIFTAELCQGNQVRVNITDTNYDEFTLDYGDGTVITVMKGAGAVTHNYATSAARTVSVTGQYTIGLACTGATATQNITPFTLLTMPDVVDLTVTIQAGGTAGALNIRFNAIAGRLYRVESKVNNGAYASAGDVTTASSGIYTHTISGLNTLANTYTFRIRNIDPCGNASANSAEISSIIIGTSALNGQNQITFTSNGGLVYTSFALYRDAVLRNNNAISPYTDGPVTCTVNYTYQIRGTLPTISTTTGTNRISYTTGSIVQAAYTATPPTIVNLNSTVDVNNRIKVECNAHTLNASVPGVASYFVERDGITYGSSTVNEFSDKGVIPASQSYCYKISYRDGCNNNSLQSTNTCTISLTLERNGETNVLTWTPYIGYQGGVSGYVVENLDESGNVVLSQPVGNVLTFSETADASLSQIIYRIRAVPADSTEVFSSVSNRESIDLSPQIYLPNTFTPNGDGVNDVLEVKGKYFKEVKMTIMNRWGEVVFISDDAASGWDGNYKGQPVTAGSYAYLLEAKDNSGNEMTQKGMVSLLR